METTLCNECGVTVCYLPARFCTLCLMTGKVSEETRAAVEAVKNDDPEIKITYIHGGYSSTAYVSENPDENGLHVGVNKHTDEPVKVRWSINGEKWEQVDD